MIDFADVEMDNAIACLRETALVLGNDKHGHFKAQALDILNRLADEARPVFAGEKFDFARGMGDLDNASGIVHLLHDYPPEVPEGKFFPVAFLNMHEEQAANALYEIYFAMDDVEGGQLGEERINAIQKEMTLFLGKSAAYRKRDLEESNHTKTETARKAKGKPAEVRRRLLKDVAEMKGWDSVSPVTMSEWKNICRAFKATYPQYKPCSNRALSKDAVVIGLRRQQSPRAKN